MNKARKIVNIDQIKPTSKPHLLVAPSRKNNQDKHLILHNENENTANIREAYSTEGKPTRMTLNNTLLTSRQNEEMASSFSFE
jgi:hypothetical protein